MVDLTDSATVDAIFREGQFDVVYHLAAQAGVKQSADYPSLFTDSNLIGFANILEACRVYRVPHLIFASSSSVYGEAAFPCTEDDRTDYPKSYYAATKKSNEVMAASYSNMYNMKITGVRFFTVYGPWGRPDMATWKFTDAILNGKSMTVYSAPGGISRDFTYIDDAIECLIKLSDDPLLRPHLTTQSRFQIYNIGGTKPVKLSTYIATLEKVIGRKAVHTITHELAPSEVSHTFSDMTKFRRHYSSHIPHTDLEVGLKNFVDWFKKYQCTKP